MPRYLQFLVELDEVKPRIWRCFQIRADATFADLHDAIQVACGWQNSHLFSFSESKSWCGFVAGSPAEDEDMEERIPDATFVALESYFRNHKRCLYVYDYGDTWRHKVTLEATADESGAGFRRLLGGERAFPPEDCGGVSGYKECIKALRAEARRRLTENDDELLRWLGTWRPEEFDLQRVAKDFDRSRRPRASCGCER